MKYISNSSDQLYAVVCGQTMLISPGQEIESSEVIKCVGLNPIIVPVKKPFVKKDKAEEKVVQKPKTKKSEN